ncbi:MAG: abortive infection family protein [Phycisphaerae bacterium]|nr:abortive infection family protein [Phycisphaerae bacterium]
MTHPQDHSHRQRVDPQLPVRHVRRRWLLRRATLHHPPATGAITTLRVIARDFHGAGNQVLHDSPPTPQLLQRTFALRADRTARRIRSQRHLLMLIDLLRLLPQRRLGENEWDSPLNIKGAVPFNSLNSLPFNRLMGCQTVVEGLGAFRNRLSDAYGRAKNAPRPLPRHAELAVNLAGAAATFLVSTLEARRSDTRKG